MCNEIKIARTQSNEILEAQKEIEDVLQIVGTLLQHFSLPHR
jgi:hypothetical protein